MKSKGDVTNVTEEEKELIFMTPQPIASDLEPGSILEAKSNAAVHECVIENRKLKTEVDMIKQKL